jgi:hypothetical protein
MTVKDMWQAAETEFNRLTGKSLQTGPTKSFEDVLAEIDSRSKPPGADATDADGHWDKEKLKSAGLKVLKCLKMLVGAATQLSSLVRRPTSSPALVKLRVCYMPADANRCKATSSVRSSGEHVCQRLDHDPGHSSGA